VCSVTVTGTTLTITVTLNPGQSVSIGYKVLVKATDSTSVKNTATITTGPCNTTKLLCTSTVTNPVPDFTVVKTDVPGNGKPVKPGSTIPYTITVANVGTGKGTAKVTDTLPTNETYVSGTAKCATTTGTNKCTVVVTGAKVTITVTLTPGQSVAVTLTATVKVTDTTSVKNVATIATGPCNSPSGCSSTVTNPIVILTVVKSSNPVSGSTVALGSTVTYSLLLTDSGTMAATNVTVTDTVPVGSTYVNNSATCGGEPTCTVTESAGVVTWSDINVAPGAANAVTITFQVTINTNDVNGQVISNVAVFTNEGTPGCTTATCHTNTVTVTVLIRSTSSATGTTTPTTTTPVRVTGATTVHTGEPWSGSGPYELLVLGLGAALIAMGEHRRRRQRGLATASKD
jgi:uncharacterized repeat protein (TIGR01451 family)